MNCFLCMFIVAGGSNGVTVEMGCNLCRKQKVLLLFFVNAVRGRSNECEISGKI